MNPPPIQALSLRDTWVDPNKHREQGWDLPRYRDRDEIQIDDRKLSASSWEGLEQARISVPTQGATNVYPPTGSSDELGAMMHEVVDALFDQDVAFKPTEGVLFRTLELVGAVGKRMDRNFPFGYVSRDGERGIRLEWKRGDRQIRLQVSDSPKTGDYIYRQEGRQRGTIEPASVESLEQGLMWLG